MRYWLAVLLICSGLAHTADLEQHWRVVLFDGRKVGHALSERRVDAGTVHSLEVLDLHIQRDSTSVPLYSESSFTESASGAPLSFAVRTRTSQIESLLRGRVLGPGRAEVVETTGGRIATREIKFDATALFAEAQLRKLRNSGLKPGSTVRFMAFEPSLLEAIAVETRVLDWRNVALLERDMRLLEVRQTVRYPQAEVEVVAFVDQQFNPYRTKMNLLGMDIEMVEGTRAQALGANQPVDYLSKLLLQAPRSLSAAETKQGLRYELEVSAAAGAALPPVTDEQAVSKAAKRLQVDVCARCGSANPKDRNAEALALAKQPTGWLQSDDPAIRSAAKRGAGAANTDLKRMQALEAFVRQHISNKNLAVGYASAREVLDSREGDCTEHALLLAALGRALQIPTRVATGFAYAPGYLGQAKVFVPHAWAQAYVDGRWQSFDAALSGFDAGHLTLSVGDGDPSRFYAGMQLLGNLKIRSISALGAAQ